MDGASYRTSGLNSLKMLVSPVMVAHTYNPITWRQRQEDDEFKASLGYIASSRSAHATQ
jgi:hypothetical protein